MASIFTFPALGANPLAARYADMAREVTKRGTHRFIYHAPHDEPNVWPCHSNRQGDNPIRHSWPWIRFRWLAHDFRMFGIRECLRKHYYIGELWRRRDEKIFCGKDENGNKYWLSWRNCGSFQGRFWEPVDPHWFRGQDQTEPSPQWAKWLAMNYAHTPAILQARGEYGYSSRSGRTLPFNIRHRRHASFHNWGYGGNNGRDPFICPVTTHIVSPDYNTYKETGFTKFGLPNQSFPFWQPFVGEHGQPQELVEEYWRSHAFFGRTSKGCDHDQYSG